jgi:tetratricopeptide (TPR) repeat protein
MNSNGALRSFVAVLVTVAASLAACGTSASRRSAAAPLAPSEMIQEEQLVDEAHRFQTESRFDEAAGVVQTLLSLREQRFGAASPPVARAVLFLGWMRVRQARYSDAADLGKRALPLILGQPHPDPRQEGDCYHLLGSATLFGIRDYVAAKKLLEQAVRLFDDGSESPALVNALQTLGDAYAGAREYDEAIRLYDRAWNIGKRVPSPAITTPKDAPVAEIDLAGILCDKALTLRYQHKPAQAEPLFLECMRDAEKKLGPDDRRLGAVYNNLGTLYHYELHDFDRAEAYYRRALAVYTMHLPDGHIRLAQVRINLGLLLCERGDWTNGEPLFDKGMTRFEVILGASHRDVIASRHYFERLVQRRETVP